MLADPSIDKIVEKSGMSRYQTALLVAKRAREIAAKRLETDSDEILDPVEVATNELVNGDIEFVDASKEEIALEDDAELNLDDVEEIDLDEE